MKTTRRLKATFDTRIAQILVLEQSPNALPHLNTVAGMLVHYTAEALGLSADGVRLLILDEETSAYWPCPQRDTLSDMAGGILDQVLNHPASMPDDVVNSGESGSAQYLELSRPVPLQDCIPASSSLVRQLIAATRPMLWLHEVQTESIASVQVRKARPVSGEPILIPHFSAAPGPTRPNWIVLLEQRDDPFSGPEWEIFFSLRDRFSPLLETARKHNFDVRHAALVEAFFRPGTSPEVADEIPAGWSAAWPRSMCGGHEEPDGQGMLFAPADWTRIISSKRKLY